MAKTIAKGKALRSSDAELDAAAEITPEDIERAREFWRANAPAPFGDLLDAEEASPIPGDDWGV